MDDLIIFRYDFELPTKLNPWDMMDRFQENLRAYFKSRGLDYGMGALGGMLHCYGDVRGRGKDATEDDRQQLATWVREQRVLCIARLGPLERLADSNLMERITDLVFEVDNLSAEDRVAVANKDEDMRRRVEALRSAD